MTWTTVPFIIGAESARRSRAARRRRPRQAPAEEPDVLVHREMSNGSVTTSQGRLAARKQPRGASLGRRDARRAHVRAGSCRDPARIAVPSFRGASLSSRLSAIANDLHASVQIARSEAIKSNTTVTLCTSTNGSSCAGSGDWEQGWIVLDVNDNVLDSHPALQDGYRVIEAGVSEVLLFSADRRRRLGGCLQGLP